MRLKFFPILPLIVVCLALTACDSFQNHLKADREGSMEIQDYRDSLASRVQDPQEIGFENDAQGSIPELQPYIASPSENMKAMPLVSLSVNQSVPLQDILFELAKQADYDLELDPRITGSIIFTAREKPFDQVIARIAKVAGLRYKFEGEVLRVELDNPYHEMYKIDYLSYIRSSAGSITNNVSVVTGEGADAGSTFSTTSESEANFWGEVETNLAQIMGGRQSGALRTASNPQISTIDQNPNIQTSNGEDPQAVLNVQSLPVDSYSNSGAGEAPGEEDFTFTINKQAGIISVYADEKTQEQVQSFLKLVKQTVTSQVLIEAKILEVTLSDQFETGINWSALDMISGELDLAFASTSASTVLDGASSPDFIAAYSGNDIQGLVRAISAFGTVRALASPRITVTNNQPAVLNVATNRVFFEVDVEKNESIDGTDQPPTISTEIKTVPEGVLVNVQPSINIDNQTVTLALRPTISRIANTVDNVGVQIAAAQASIDIPDIATSVPELSVQELDSVVMTRSGQPIILGGLLQDRVESEQNGVPVLSEVPVMGGLFRNQSDNIVKTELVIFLKTTILESPADSIHATDKDLYRKFSSDRRPFRL